MSIYLDQAARTLFDDQSKAAYQSAGPDLRPYTSFRSVSGAQSYTYQTHGRVVARARGASQTEATNANMSHDPVTVTPAAYYVSDLSDVFDQDLTNIQEVPSMARAFGMAAKRKETQTVIDACVAGTPALTIAHGSAGMTEAKIRQVRAHFKSYDIMEPICLLLTEEQESDLIGESGGRFASADYASAQAAATGDIRQGHYGIARYVLIGSGRSETGLPKASTTRSCFAFVPSAIGLVVGFNGNIRNEVNYDEGKFSWRVSTLLRAGAGVIDTVGLVEIQCTEAS